MRRNVLFVTAVCLMLFLFPVMARAEGEESGQSQAKMEIFWGQEYSVPIGRNMFFTALVSADGAFQGSVTVDVPLGNNEYYSVEKAFQLEQAGDTQIDFQLMIYYNTNSIRFSLKNDDGELISQENISLTPSYTFYDLRILAATDTVEPYTWMEGIQIQEDVELTTSLRLIGSGDLPEAAGSYGICDVLMLDQLDSAVLSERQKNAMEQWISAGGILIVDKDSDFCKASDGEIVREFFDEGLVISCGFSMPELADRFQEESDRDEFFSFLLGEKQWKKMVDRIIYGYNEYYNAAAITANVDYQRVPRLTAFIVCLLIYLILVGPILYFTLKKNRIQNFLRVGMVSIALVFTFVIYLMGSRTRSTGPIASYVRFTDIDGNHWNDRVYIDFQSPYSDPYSVEISGDYHADYLSDLGSDYPNAQWDVYSRRLVLKREQDRVFLHADGNIPFTREYLYLTRTGENEETMGITGKILLTPEGLRGSLINRTGMDLAQVSIWVADHVVSLGEVKADQTVVLDETEFLSALYPYREGLFGEISGSSRYGSAVSSKDASYCYWKERILQNRVGYAGINSRYAVIYGFCDNREEQDIIRSGAAVSGIRVVCCEIPVDNRIDSNHKFHANLRDEVTTLSGYYDKEYYSTFEGEVILQIETGDETLEKLYVEWPMQEKMSEYYRAYNGELEFFCPRIGDYEIVERKAEYSAQELAGYIGRDNKILIRLRNDEEDYSHEIQLPVFSYLGRKTQ